MDQMKKGKGIMKIHYPHIFPPRLSLERRGSDVKRYCILMQCGCIYRRQMLIKMQRGVFKISNK